jgi:signal transduction histidine kinase
MSSPALILHDDERTLSLVRGLLESAGYETASAASAYRLLSLETAEPPRLVLLGMTALDDRDVELVSILRRRWPDAWILAMFPAALRERAAHALAFGADASLPEPFYAGELLAIARRVMARTAAPGPPAAETGAAPPAAPPAPGAVENLAGGVAHMIRNPLQIIALQLETGEADGAVDVPGLREQIGRIEGVVEELARYAGGRSVAREPVDVGELVAHAFAARSKKKTAGPTITVKAADEKAETLGSAELLRGVFETLRRRADAVTPGDGKIDVRVQVRVDAGRRIVEVSVTDGGPRLADARRARLFDPFPDAETLRDGTGLELAALAGVVRDHGGAATASAAGPVGTTIVVRLPARETGAQPKGKTR